MAELGQEPRQEAQRIAAQALVGDMPAGAERLFSRAGLDHAKPFFCEQWDEIRKVLQFLGDTVGGVVKRVVKALFAGKSRVSEG